MICASDCSSSSRTYFNNTDPYAVKIGDYFLLNLNAGFPVGNNLTKTVTTVQFGNHTLNRFLMTRVTKNVPAHALIKY